MKIIFVMLIVFCSFQTHAQTTLIPDPNFEQSLINLGYDTGPIDGGIPTANISGITWLNVGTVGISDLSGIEDFISLDTLLCHNNNLTLLDLSQNLNLINLSCGNNNLTLIDVTQCINLARLTCSYNQLVSIDVSQNIALTWFTISNNELTSIDIGQNTALETFGCEWNSIDSIDATSNNALIFLGCEQNYSIDALYLPQSTTLETVLCGYNNISSLDISQCTGVYQLRCSNNDLIHLNAANGNNTNFTQFEAENNLLNCIQVDNTIYSNDNWMAGKDPTAFFSENCPLGVEEFEDIIISIAPNPVHSELHINSNVEVISMEIYSVTGTFVQSVMSTITPIDHLPNGLYVLQVETIKGVIYKKFLKQ